MPTSQEEREEASYRANVETIRSAAKWFVAAFAALGSILVAGSQLSSIGALDSSEGRFWAAVGAMGVALVSVLIMVWRAVRLLLPSSITVDDLVRMEQRRRKSPAIRWFEDNPTQKPYDTFAVLQEAWQLVGDETATEKPSWERLDAATRKVRREATVATLRADFRRMTLEVGFAALVAAAAIGVFAWAANPPDEEAVNAVSLRNLDLAGVNLRGANLARADLAGVNFTSANLRGATLKGAAVKDALWSKTTCPDGTNSDDHAPVRGEDAGKGTCEGHLVP